MKRIAVGADHAGIYLKNHLADWLKEKGFDVVDLGTHNTNSCHYPDYAEAVAREVQKGALGLLVCGTGLGMSIAANKLSGIRAAVVSETFSARAAKEHNNANILCMGARVVGSGLAEDCLEAWLNAEFQGGRHSLRVDMLTELENKKIGAKDVS